MLVLDASVVVDVLLNRKPFCDAIIAYIAQDTQLAAPHLLDAEVAQVIRRFVMRGELSEVRAKAALEDLRDLPIKRYPHDFLIEAAFALRHNLTIYDALYVTLADGLNAQLLTRDKGIAKVPNVGCEIVLIQG